MYVYHSIQQLGTLIKSWPTQTEKFLSATLPPLDHYFAAYEYSSYCELLYIYNNLHPIMHLRSEYQTETLIQHNFMLLLQGDTSATQCYHKM